VNAPWIAVLTAPSANEAVIQGANGLIFEYLKSASKNQLDPAALLNHLRLRFRWNGYDFTPTLDYFDRGVPREQLRPFGIFHTQTSQATSEVGLPGRLQKPVFGLFADFVARDGLAMSVEADTSVRILCRDLDGQMRFVAIGDTLFGWVRSDALVE